MKFPKRLLRTACMLLCAAIAAGQAGMPARAEEYYEDGYYEDGQGWEDSSWEESWEDTGDSDDSDTEETEYIPEAYYAPIQTNELKGWPQGQAVQAASAIVMDMDTGAVLYGKSIYDSHYPASITKIMTLLVAVENGNLDDVIACSEEVYNIEAESSNAGIAPGEEVTLRQALYGLMLESANDLGMAIAVHIGGSVSGFAQMMNDKAQELGCVNTHFVNPHGLHHPDHYVSAYDMALIGQAAYANETCRDFMSTVEAHINPTNLTEETRYFINHQRLLRKDSEYYQSWCTGGKTGYTTDAWNTLVTFGEKNGLRLVCVLLRENGLDRSYLETIDLMEYGFENFRHKTVDLSVESPTFYELIGFNYPNPDGVIYQSDLLKQKVLTVANPGTVTLPESVSVESLTSGGGKEPGEIRYYYGDWPVGSGQIAFTPFPSGIHYAFEEERNMGEILETAKKTKREDEIEETFHKAWSSIESFGGKVYAWAADYVEHNRMTVVLAGALVLFVLLILIAIMILRVTSDYRIRRRRKAEERQRRRREEEIDRKSAVEIEEELREVMREEQKKREQEERRAALEREKEEKLREAESVLEEIERMEQEERRLKKEQDVNH